MKLRAILPLIAAVLGISMSIHAQTTITAVLDPASTGYISQIGQDGFSCGRSSMNCYGIPFLFPDGTVERAWVDTSPVSHFIYWVYGDPLGLQGFTPDPGFYGADITSTDYTVPPTYHFYGTNASGQPYTGTISLMFRSYRTNGGGGKGGGGAGTIYIVTAATMTITQ